MIVLSFTRIFRLLDVCLGRKTLYETQIMLVFEHIDQDLDMYLKEAPEAGLEDNQIKVWLCLHYAGTFHSDSVFGDGFNELCVMPLANSSMLLIDFQQHLNFKAVIEITLLRLGFAFVLAGLNRIADFRLRHWPGQLSQFVTEGNAFLAIRRYPMQAPDSREVFQDCIDFHCTPVSCFHSYQKGDSS